MFLLLFLLVITTELGVVAPHSPDQSTATPINTSKNRKLAKETLLIVKNFMTNVSGTNKKILVTSIFGVSDALLQYSLTNDDVKDIQEIEDELATVGSELVNAIEEMKDICANVNFQKIAVDAKAKLRAMSNVLKKTPNAVDKFLHACNTGESLMMRIWSVKQLLQYPKTNPLITAIDADPFHKLGTMIHMRKEMLKTLRALASVEIFRIRRENETALEMQNEEADAVNEAVDEIDKLMEASIAGYDKEIYFGKVEGIVRSVMSDDRSGDDQTRATALMQALMEIHTRDRFVVTVYDKQCDLPQFLFARKDNHYINEEYRTIVYRSEEMFYVKEHRVRSVVKVERFPGDRYHCDELTASIVKGEMLRAGLVLLHNCQHATVTDKRAVGIMNHTIECRSGHLSGGYKSSVNASSYPW